jgi:hypothetical protein
MPSKYGEGSWVSAISIIYRCKRSLGVDNFERASLPITTPEERRRLLSFVVCGGGPTGVEAAAEIYDLCQEDIMQYYPKICRQEVSIHVIQSGEHILNTVSSVIGISGSLIPNFRVLVFRSNFQICRGRLCLCLSPPLSQRKTLG